MSSHTRYNSEMHFPPLVESDQLGAPANPYARSKLIAEQILTDLTLADERWSIALLRYFNPVGAHSSGLIGENPLGKPHNLLPFIAQVAVGRLSELLVYGDDYPTHDGAGVCDYIHVTNLPLGHLKALMKISETKGVSVWNLGAGRGYSVFEVIHAFESVAGRKIPFRIVPRRAGDMAAHWSDPSKAELELDWRAEKSIEQMVSDTWRWQVNNPNGYGGKESQ